MTHLRLRPALGITTTLHLFLAAILGFTAAHVDAQDASAPTSTTEALRIFLECSGQACDEDEFRTQIDWVNWMRDRADADVHIIVTRQETGSGGSLYLLDFLGQGTLDGADDQLRFTTLGTDVRDEAVRGLTRVLAVGVGRYSVLSGAGAPFDLVGTEPDDLTDRLVTSDQVDDPWNFWVFEVDASTELSGETSRTNREFESSLEARRTTTTWKLAIEFGGSWRRNEIQLSDTTIIDSRRDWEAEFVAVYALADHWSFGGGAEVSAATRTNQDLAVGVGPRLEFSVWPYEESPRRSLRVRYDLGVRYFDYEEITLFDQLSETRPFEEMEISISQRQPWGSVFANVAASHYLHDPDRYRVSAGGFMSYRLVRGLSLNLDGRVEWIRDQLFLPAADISDEEILLERRRLASNFDWEFDVGFSFQFGSIFNNVVNNRF